MLNAPCDLAMGSSVNLNPSFSSTLLDSIYRSFDQCQDDLSDFRRATVTTKKLGGCTPLNRTKSYNNGGFHGSEPAGGTRRACHNGVAPRNSDAAGSGRKSTALKNYYSHGGSSAGYGCGDVFSSEAELSGGYGTSLRPKPIRTRISDEKFNNVNKLCSQDHREYPSQQKPKHEGGKYRALENYGDLKRVNKTPISPAGKLAIFLNSLFTAKKTKSGSSSGVGRRVKSENASACSSASSFARSCLSKHTPSSRINSAGKRTVTFFPVSVIIGEDCRPCGHKNLVNYDQKKVERECDYLTNGHLKNLEIFEIDEDDLFELDNLSAIGKERYGEELPVYETTHLGNRRAIANGLIL